MSGNSVINKVVLRNERKTERQSLLTRMPTCVSFILLAQLEDEPVEDDTRTSMTSRKGVCPLIGRKKL